MKAMIESGVKWLGDIPTSWGLGKIGGLYSLRTEKVSDKDYPPLSVTMKGILPQLETAAKTNDGDNRKLVKKGDFAINSRSDRRGSCGISAYDGSVSLINLVLTPRNEMCPQYYNWLFHTIQFADEFYRWGHGIVSDLWSTNWQEMKKITIPIPPLNEQQVIADYLDMKCLKIDSLLESLQMQLKQLQRYRESTITEAVTHGLDPDVKLIDSERDWCPQIPAHWIPTNPKALFSLRNQRAKDGDRQLTASQKLGIVYQDDFMEAEGQKVVTVEKDFSILKHVEPNDFVISMRSFQGGLEYSELRGSISSAYVMLIPNEEKVHPPFYKWFFKSSKYINAIQSTTNLVRDGQAMRYANFVKVPLFIIPMHEQVQIADYLNNRIPQIDAVISEKQEQISILTAYKKSLIFEHVTGKKEVPAPFTAVMVDPNVILLGKLPKLLSQQKGKIYNQKVLYLLNIYLGLNLGVQYYRYKHGPYDIMLDFYIDTLVENGWCVKTTKNGAENLEIGPNYGAFEEQYGSYFSEFDAEINSLIQFVQPMKRSQIERVATLFAVWNDMILDGNSVPTDTEIVSEVMSGWTENKANFAYDTWLGTLNKMRGNGIIPKGQGLHTLPKDC